MKTRQPCAQPARRRCLRASPFRRCCRTWIRHQGRIIRLLTVDDYTPCLLRQEPRYFVKRITHRRWPRGWHMSGVEWSKQLTAAYANLPGDKWVEMVFE